MCELFQYGGALYTHILTCVNYFSMKVAYTYFDMCELFQYGGALHMNELFQYGGALHIF